MQWLHLLGNLAGLAVLGTLLYHIVRANQAGAPFIPTVGVKRMIKLADIRPKDIVYELGCGDGGFSVAAAMAGAAKVVGYDISGLWVSLARVRAKWGGVAHRCTFKVQNIRVCVPKEATLVYLYLMPEITDSLAGGPLLWLQPGARVLSSSFPIDTTKHRGFRLLTQQKIGLSAAYLYERI